MRNLAEHIKEINCDFTNVIFAKFMQGQWGINVGYSIPNLLISVMRKTVADWQLLSDCNNTLCVATTSGTTVITSYPTWGNSPFPQIVDSRSCYIEAITGASAVPETVNIIVPPLLITQYEVGSSNGPTAGTNVFTPLNSVRIPVLIDRTVDIALGAFLELGVDYSFNITTGTITLLLGRLFNAGEVYTIISY